MKTATACTIRYPRARLRSPERHVDPGFRPRLAEWSPTASPSEKGRSAGRPASTTIGSARNTIAGYFKRRPRDLHRSRDEMDGQ
jgi:hypothetical protein